MPSPESINMQPEVGGRPPEAVETPDEKIIREFDAETKKLQAQKKYLEGQISNKEEQMKLNEKLRVPSSINAAVQAEIAKFNEDIQPLSTELAGRGPSPEEDAVSQEMQAVDARISRIKGEQQASPNVPASIEEGRKKDIEALQTEKEQKMRELQQKKIERIKKLQGGEESVPQPEAQAPKIEQPSVEAPEVVSEQPEATKSEDELKREDFKGQLNDYLTMLDRGGAGKMEGDSAPYRYAREAFRELTGEDLEAAADERAETEFTYSGRARVREGAEGDSYKATRLEEIRASQRTEAINIAWGRLSKQEQSKYQNIGEYAMALEGQRDKLEKQGIPISQDSFYQLIKDGYRPEDAGKAGFFARMSKGAMKIGRVLPGRESQRDNAYFSKKDFQQLLTSAGQKFNIEASGKLAEELKKEEQEFQQTKEKHMKDLILEAANGTFPLKKAEIEAEPAAAVPEEMPSETAPAAEMETPPAEEMPLPEVVAEQEAGREITIKDLKKNEAMEFRIELNSEKKVKKLMESIVSYGSKVGLNPAEIKYLKTRVVGGKADSRYKGLEKIEAFQVAVKVYEREYISIILERMRAKFELFQGALPPEELGANITPISEAEVEQAA